MTSKYIYNSYPECTEQEQEEYFSVADRFLSSTYLYGSESGTARCAIADYLAFKDGCKLIRNNPSK